MKIKELPLSWWKAKKLSRIPIEQLQKKSLGAAPVIVSLTSIASRLDLLHITIRSLFTQSLPPQKIILWLNESLASQTPISLLDLQCDQFEIRYRDLNCPHRKLIFCLSEYPDTDVITCDDDVIYHTDWLKTLYNDHLIYPRDIIAHECRIIRINDDGVLAPYKEWTNVENAGAYDYWLMPIGYGGVYYPAKCLHTDATNKELFLKLTPRADDLWFKAMALLVNTRSRRTNTPVTKPIPIIGSQKESLKKTNVKSTGNYDQWLAVSDHYQLHQHFVKNK